MNAPGKLNWTVAMLDAIDPVTLFRMLRLRVDTFVVEQRCAYPELDDADELAWHVFATDDVGTVIACARIIPPVSNGVPHLGRFVVHSRHRGQGLAHELVRRCQAELLELYGSRRSELAAQVHLSAFYASHGYRAVSAPYDWDGIPHVDMRCDE